MDNAAEVDLRLEVSRRGYVADGVVVLELRDPAGGTLPPWSPGAHVELRLGPDLVRQYSLCGDPGDDTTWKIAVLREDESRGGSQYVHDKIQQNDLLDVRGPRNHFALEPAPRYVFIAGGIGITPILPMVAAAEAAGAEWVLHHGGRSRTTMAFTSELLDDHGSRVEVLPQDEVGLLDLEAILGDPDPETLVYCCGPEPLLLAVEARCEAWPTGALHVERFTPKQREVPAHDGTFEVELARTGATLRVPLDRSILDAVTAAGIDAPYSCTEGMCGTCETPVLDGEVDHRDSLRSSAEQADATSMFICVSRAAGARLVLDL